MFLNWLIWILSMFLPVANLNSNRFLNLNLSNYSNLNQIYSLFGVNFQIYHVIDSIITNERVIHSKKIFFF
ncbi:hypothetical protein C2G38_1668577 [Gigaspora rosea]|uniref:Secreted protein n=1 Tax=Gigaspora rosea TaxID=44941 RepID=A0A397V2Y7_9GLOM|nr:hypothetical protein C2G38_1668577 [Gigaspora rosea]